MAPSPLPCDSCSASIHDSDFETGNAISVLGKNYCARCKGEAVKKISLEDLAAPAKGGRAPAAAAPRPPAKAVLPAPRPRTPSPKPPAGAAPAPALRPGPVAPVPAKPTADNQGRPLDARGKPAPADRSRVPARPPVSRPSNAKPILIIAGIVVALGAALGGMKLFGGKENTPTSGGGSTGTSGTGGKTTAVLTPEQKEAQAESVYRGVEFLHERGDAPESVLAALEKARPKCRETKWEAKLDELRGRILRDQEAREALKTLAPMIDELKAGVAADKDFKRFGELQAKFLSARDLAARSGANKLAEIQEIQSAYRSRYEEAAQPFYADIHEAASVLADEKRYDDALKRIEAFPAHLRQSRHWNSLERMKDDIEKRRKLQPQK